MTLSGAVSLPDYNVAFNTKKGLWTFDVSLGTKELSFSARTNLHIGKPYKAIQYNTKLEDMPEEDWQKYSSAKSRYIGHFFPSHHSEWALS